MFLDLSMDCIPIKDYNPRRVAKGFNIIKLFDESGIVAEKIHEWIGREVYYFHGVKKKKIAIYKINASKQSQLHQLLKEVHYYNIFSGNPHVLQLISCVYEEPKINEVTRSIDNFSTGYYLLFERFIQNLASKSDRLSLVDFYRRKFDYLEKLKLILKIALTVQVLHQKKVVHGNIKPENLVVLKNDFSKVKIINFSNAVPEGKQSQGEVIMFMAPENLIKLDKMYRPFDIFSFGITIAMLEIGRRPLIRIKENFRGFENTERYVKALARAIRQEFPDIPIDESLDTDSILKIVEDCLQFDANTRPEISQIIDRLEKLIEKFEAQKKTGSNLENSHSDGNREKTETEVKFRPPKRRVEIDTGLLESKPNNQNEKSDADFMGSNDVSKDDLSFLSGNYKTEIFEDDDFSDEFEFYQESHGGRNIRNYFISLSIAFFVSAILFYIALDK